MEGKDLFALLPCPVKVAMEGEFKEYIEEIEKDKKRKYDYLIEANANKNFAVDNFVEKYKAYEDIPSIVISAGINDLFGADFYNKFIKTGSFSGKRSKDYYELVSEDFAKDPDRSYNIIGCNILIMVVDLTKIGNRKIPTSFKDILDEEFENSVAIRGEKNKFCETTLLTIYKEYGINGIKKLSRSVKKGYHPSEMVQLAGKDLSEAPAISIMPYFYSKNIRNTDKVLVVWPEEGAIVSPITMIVKKECEEELKSIVDFFMGEVTAKLFCDVNFITLNKNIKNKLPENKKYYWPGWEYIRKNDIKEVVNSLNNIFVEGKF